MLIFLRYFVNNFIFLTVYNKLFFQQRLEMYNKQISKLSKSLKESWPPGQRPGAIPATRFDMPRQYYFNTTHIFLPDDFTVLRRHTEPELLDIQVSNVRYHCSTVKTLIICRIY